MDQSNDWIAQRFFSIREMKQIITHTKGYHGWKNLNQTSNVKGAIREDSTDKSLKPSKECKRHGNEEQTNILVIILLQSCGVLAKSNQMQR